MRRLSIEIKTETDEQLIKEAKSKSALMGIKLREFIFEAIKKLLRGGEK